MAEERQVVVARQYYQNLAGIWVPVTPTTQLPVVDTELIAALATAIEAAMDTGTATGGSNITIVDTGKSWEVNMWTDATFEVEIGAVRYLGIVLTNTATTITFAALPGAATVIAGCDYALKRPVDIADITDRAGRLLGVVYGSRAQQLQQRAATFELLVQLMSAGAQIDPRAIRALTAADVVDVSDRWARIVGQVDLARVLGAAMTAANPAIIGLFDAAANRMPAMDAAARPGFIDVIDRAARLLGVISAGTNLIGAINPRAEAGAGQAPVGVNVTVASTQILAVNANRKVAIITNDSDTEMWLAIGQAAVANQGIPLTTKGSVLVISRTGDIFSTEAVNGIHAGVGNKVATGQELN